MKKVLYVGGFILPDKNAAAHRVLANGKAISKLGYEVSFQNIEFKSAHVDDTSFFLEEKDGMKIYNFKKTKSLVNYFKKYFSIGDIKALINNIGNVDFIIAYNLHILPTFLLYVYCKKKKIKLIGDITEWYDVKDKNILKYIYNFINVNMNMRIMYKKFYGLILISSSLRDYYVTVENKILIPPLVDINEKKWKITKSKNDVATITYAGSPSARKENLKFIIDIFRRMSQDIEFIFNIVGITEKQYREMYFDEGVIGTNIVFYGKVSHKDALKIVSGSDYTIIYRDNNVTTKMGFPTKFVESISLSTPAIFNDNSDLKKYNPEFGILCEKRNFENVLSEVITKRSEILFDNNEFHYEKYVTLFSHLLEFESSKSS